MTNCITGRFARHAARLATLALTAVALTHCPSPVNLSDAAPDAPPSDVATDTSPAHDDAADLATPDATLDVATDAPSFDVQPDRFIDVQPDIAPDEIHRDGGALTLMYVVSRLTVDPTPDPLVPHTGFNVDGLYSTGNDPNGCFQADFFSMYDDDQHCASVDGPSYTCLLLPGCARGTAGCAGGVDNQIPFIANTLMTATMYDLRAQLQGTIDTSKLVVLMRLTDVDDLTNDPSIGVSLYNGFSAFGTGCTSVQPNRVYRVARSSLRPGGTTLDDAAFQMGARIVNGRLQAGSGSADTFDLAVPVSPGMSATFHLHAMQLRMDITMAGGSNGNVGGWALGREVADSIIVAQPTMQRLIEATVSAAVDVRYMGVCDDTSRHPRGFGGISAGFGMQAVPATIDPLNLVSDAAPMGSCSAM